MEEEKKTEDVKKKIEKKTGIKVYHVIIIFMALIIAILGVQIYSTSNGYGGIVGLVKGEKKEESVSSQKENETKKVEEVKKEFTDSEVKEAFQKYLDIIGAREGSFEAMLDELGIKATDSAFIEGKGYVTNVKFSTYKEALLQYVTEDFFEKAFAKGHDDNGYLMYSMGGGTGMKMKVVSVEKIGENEYKGKIDYESEVRTEVNTMIFTIAEYNGRCVIAGQRELSADEVAGDIVTSTVDNNTTSVTSTKSLEEANITNMVNKTGVIGEITYNDLIPATAFTDSFNVTLENSKVYFELRDKEYFEKYFITNSSINRIENQKEEITGFNGKVKNVYFYSDGQALTERDSAILFLMDDGKIEYISLVDALQTNNLKSRGEITGLNNINEIYSASARELVDETGGPGWRACVVKDSNGNYYDMKTVFDKNNIDLSKVN